MMAAGLGAAVGLIAALVLTPAMGSQLYGIAPADPATIAACWASFSSRRSDALR